MTTKLPTKRDVRFILAEDLRQEAPGKLSIFGFMAGDQILVGGDPPKEFPGAAFILPSLAFLFVISAGEGNFGGRLRVIAPDRKTVVFDAPFQAPLEKKKGVSAIFGTGARPFLGPSYGTYTAEFTLQEVRFKFPILIEKAGVDK